MLRLRSRVLISLTSGIGAVGLVALPFLFSGHPDEKTVADFHRNPFLFSLVSAAIGAVIAVAVFIALSLIAWTVKRWFGRTPATTETIQQLYSPNQAFGGVFLGGPLAAVSMIKSNYLTLGNHDYAKKAVVFGWAAFLVFLAAILAMTYWSIGFKGIGTGIGIANASSARSIVSTLQRSKQAILESDRYSFKSNWRVVGVGLSYLAVTLAVIFIALYILIAAGYHMPK